MLPPQPVEHEPVNCENINSKLFPAYPFRETLTNRRTEVLLPNSINFKISNERQGRDAYRHYGNNYLFHNVNRQRTVSPKKQFNVGLSKTKFI